ncbi:hypothetical protein HMN09_00122100 [Mycena chlorophos]|uniref:DUF7730 domain-containing protein n=1 Tax=Mycena chlorophos TaxID=658473 RepID=A0A8H6TVC3_MYCCL|nr:hypothetical protein HMN09_00122100 [Mycena chlorophos]
MGFQFFSRVLDAFDCFFGTPLLLIFFLYNNRRKFGPLPANLTPFAELEPLPAHSEIDVAQRPIAPQRTSAFLRLPCELKELIYIEALGGRQILLHVERDWEVRRRVVRSSCFSNSNTPVDHPTVALIRVCRQITWQAQAVLLQTNTFTVTTKEMDRTLLASLGVYGLARVRSLVLEYNKAGHMFPHCPTLFDEGDALQRPPCKQLLDVLHHMTDLRTLVFRFAADAKEEYSAAAHTVDYDPRALLDTRWGGRLCAMRSLGQVRFEFLFGGDVRELEDRRWEELGKGIVRRVAEVDATAG